MPAPILILAREAADVRDWLAPRLDGERLIAVSDVEALPAALAEDPEIAFLINHPGMPGAAYREVLACPSIRWVQVGGSGYEYIGGWDRARVTVTNGAGLLAPYLAETTIGAMLALNHGLIGYRDRQMRREWHPRPFRPLAGQTLAVVGAGEIGRRVAGLAAGLGMKVAGLNRSGAAVAEIPEMRPLGALDEVISEADIVSCHLRLTPETAGIFSRARFAAMKSGALFLNSARGGHVDEAALVEALESGQLGGAWCDVFATEPLPPESPLWSAPNLLVTPHAADSIAGWELRFAAFFAENLTRWREGAPLQKQV